MLFIQAIKTSEIGLCPFAIINIHELKTFIEPINLFQIYQKKTDLYTFLNIAVPFGRVMDTNIDCVIQKLSCKSALISHKVNSLQCILGIFQLKKF